MQDKYNNSTFSEKLIINRAKVSAKTNMKWDHYHDFYEVYYYLGNEMNYFIDNKTFNVKKHDIIFIDRYILHRTLYTPQNHGERILILFDPDILSLLADEELIEKVKKIFQQKKVSLDSFYQHSIDDIMNRICDYYFNSSNPSAEIKARLGLLELLLNVLELPQNSSADNQTPEVSPKEKRVSEVVTYINSHYHSDISLGILCKELFINKYYLCHIFKEVTGLSVIDFINTKRLAEAERLLRYSRLSITEVCEAVGFNSISHFISLFKKSYNNTPRDFRNSLEKR